MSPGVEQRVQELIEPSLMEAGFEVVRVRFAQGTLQIMAERRDEQPVTVDDCGRISQTVSALLDVEEPIKSRYMLEVSSPGLDRPLTRLSDYERFAGRLARVETAAPVEGRRKFTGVLRGADGRNVRLEIADEPKGALDIPFASITQARLDESSALLKAPKPGHAPSRKRDHPGKPDPSGAGLEKVRTRRKNP